MKRTSVSVTSNSVIEFSPIRTSTTLPSFDPKLQNTVNQSAISTFSQLFKNKYLIMNFLKKGSVQKIWCSIQGLVEFGKIAGGSLQQWFSTAGSH